MMVLVNNFTEMPESIKKTTFLKNEPLACCLFKIPMLVHNPKNYAICEFNKKNRFEETF